MKEEDIRPQHMFNAYLETIQRDVDAKFSDPASFQVVPCPMCGSSHHNSDLVKDRFQYATCLMCGSLYLSPRPSAGEIGQFYVDSESARFWATRFYKETESARREKIFRPRAQLVAEQAKHYGLSTNATLIDIGAGYGMFLEEMTHLNCFGQIIGIEPSSDMVAICRDKGFRMVQKTAEELQSGDASASFATCFEVIEHVYDPLTFLQGISRAILPDGLLLLTTLTVSGFDIQVLWENARIVIPPLHINFMSIEGADRLFTRAGFEVLDVSTPGALDIDIVRNTVAQDPSIHIPRFVRRLLDSPPETQAAFQEFLQGYRMSSHIRVIARNST